MNLASLPEKTGVTETASLVKQGDVLTDIDLYPITNVTAQYDNGQLVARSYAADGTEIHALSNEVVMDTSYAYFTKNGSTTRTIFASIESIKDIDSISKEIKVDVNGVSTNTSYVYDLSDMSLIERIDLLYDLNELSEEEKISLYCDLTTLPQEESGLMCGTSIRQDLEEYYNRNINSTDKEIQATVATVDSVVRSHVGPYLQEGLRNISVGGFNYQIHYEAGTGGPNSIVLASVAATVRDVHNFFVNNGFNTPRKPSGEDYYHIYLISGLAEYGEAVAQDSFLSSTAASYIELKFNAEEQYSTSTNSVTSLFEFTVAHEMYHAISFTYRYNMGDEDRWFDESFANWAGVRYTADGANAAGYVRSYLADTSVSPQDMGDEDVKKYGFCVYALTLDLYNGGIPTIRAILEATEDTNNAYTAIQNGIDEVNQSYTLAGEAFNYCSLYICKPTEFYSYATTAWGTASYTSRYDTDVYTVTGDSFTSSRHEYNLQSSSAKTLSISIQANAGVSGTGLIRIKADETVEVIAPTSLNGDLTTYVINNYGTTYREVILSIVNGSTTSDNLNCTVTSSLN